MVRFWDQGKAICSLGGVLDTLQRRQEAGKQFERARAIKKLWASRVSSEVNKEIKEEDEARAIGAAHGFFSVECHACLGLGKLAIHTGRQEEGLDLLRNA